MAASTAHKRLWTRTCLGGRLRLHCLSPVAALIASAGLALPGCTTTSNKPQFGEDPAGGPKPAMALSPVAAFGQSVSKTFRAGSDKVSAAFKPKPQEPMEEETWWPFKKKEQGPGADFYVSLARVREQSGSFDLAFEQYDKALKIDPNHAPAMLGYAHLLDRQGQKVKATEYYQMAAKAHPEDASIANDLGLCYARQGKLDEALVHLQHAIDLQPKRDLYRNNIATILVEMNRVDEAVAQVAAVYGEPIAHYNIGVLLKQQGQRQAATEQFALALQKDPGFAQAREWLERMNAESGPRDQLARAGAIEKTSAISAPLTSGQPAAMGDRALNSDAAQNASAVPASVPSSLRWTEGSDAAGAPGVPLSPDQARKQVTVDADPATVPTPQSTMSRLNNVQPGYVPPSRY